MNFIFSENYNDILNPHATRWFPAIELQFALRWFRDKKGRVLYFRWDEKETGGL